MNPDGRFHIGHLTSADVDLFLALAAEEGWVSHRWELEFLMTRFPGGCLSVGIGDRVVGFVTSLRHDRSGWVGNLIVSPEARRSGLGRALMELALQELEKEGVGTVWLTASSAGRHLYESLSFRQMDTIERWSGTGFGGGCSSPVTVPIEQLVERDALGWGDTREALLAAVLSRGELFADGEGYLILQSVGSAFALGPWTGDDVTAAALLDRALQSVGGNSTVLLDAPAGNPYVAQILATRGFSRLSSTLLMCRGTVPRYCPEQIYSLASMGSMG